MSNMGIKNEIVMELSIKLAEKELCDNHDVKVDDISEERDGCYCYKENCQDEFNSLYDKYYNLLINFWSNIKKVQACPQWHAFFCVIGAGRLNVNIRLIIGHTPI